MAILNASIANPALWARSFASAARTFATAARSAASPAILAATARRRFDRIVNFPLYRIARLAVTSTPRTPSATRPVPAIELRRQLSVRSRFCRQN